MTVRLLDAEGLAKFSMRRLAAELNVTAMSVYWYVDTKDDLLELALDAAFGELNLPDPEATRTGGTSCAPWPASTAPSWSATPGCPRWPAPSSTSARTRWPSRSCVQRVVRNTGLPVHGLSGALSAVFQFVYGYGTIEGHFIARVRGRGHDPGRVLPARDERGDPGTRGRRGHPGVQADVMEARGGDTVQEMRERDFTFALDLLVAGIEAMVERSGS